ncbi:MAG: ECF transporter S component [Ruminococcus sp.]|nr:ECF transporter S component [Ruminococcus sp.]
MKTNTFFTTKNLVILGLMTALVIIFSMTPIGSIPINPELSITLNVIPIAIAAIACGPVGGAIVGGIFGIFSFLQCFGIGVPSGLGAALVNISPVLAFIQRFVPRLLDGLLTGLVFKFLKDKTNKSVSCGITGLCAALFNTILFMAALVILFYNTDKLNELRDGKNVIWFIITFVGFNALLEMAVSTIVTSAVGTALYKARLIKEPSAA